MSRKATAAARRTRCRTASVPTSTGASGTRRLGLPDAPDRPPRPPRRRAAPPAPRAAGSRRPAASSCAAARRPRRRSGRVLAATRAAQHLLVAWPLTPRHRSGRTAPAPRSGGRPAGGRRPCGCRRRPEGRVAAAAGSSSTERARRTNSSENMPGARVGPAPVDQLERRPSPPAPRGPAARTFSRSGGGQRDRRDGRDQDARGAVAPGPFDQRRRPRCTWARSPPGRRRRARRARRAAASRGTGAQAPARLPTTMGHPALASLPGPGGRAAAAHQPGGQALGPAGGRDQHDDAARAGPHGRGPRPRRAPGR